MQRLKKKTQLLIYGVVCSLNSAFRSSSWISISRGKMKCPIRDVCIWYNGIEGLGLLDLFEATDTTD